MRLAFVGLGVMGFPMAGHLAAGGHEVRVFNRTVAKSQAWQERHDGQAAATPAEAARATQAVALCVGNDDDVRQVVLGEDGVLAGLAPGGVIVDHTTTSATLARELAEISGQQGVGFVDAPVSGGQAGAENGVLTIMAGGDPESFASVEPMLACYAQMARLLGPSGSGQLAKMVNQICIAGLVQGLAEGLHFAQQAGLDAESVVEVISQGAAQSWQMDNRASTMLADQFDFGFAVDWMRKDLGIAMDEAHRNGATLDVASLVDGFYAEVQTMGGGRWDTSSLLRRLTASSKPDA